MRGTTKKPGQGRAKRYSSSSELRAVRAEGTDVRRPWLRSFLPLLACYAAPRDLAKDLGVTYQTLYRWGVLGEEIPERGRLLLDFVAASKGVPSPSPI